MPEAVAPEVCADPSSADSSRAKALKAPAATGQSCGDEELMGAWSKFVDAHNELDRLLEADTEPDEHRMLLLHGLWHGACIEAASLPAITPEGRRAKATMLLAVMDVALGERIEHRQLHEILAASLARDC